MNWYCVHAIHYFEYETGEQDDYIVWEHMYLIQADDERAAYDKGKVRAKQDEGDASDQTTVNGRPARLRFAGIRKTVSCEDLDLRSGVPTDGTEVSYSELLVQRFLFTAPR